MCIRDSAKSIQEKLIDRGLVNEDGSVVETLRLDAPVPKDTTPPDVPLRPYEETDLTTPAEATGIPDIKQFEENIKSDLEKKFGITVEALDLDFSSLDNIEKKLFPSPLVNRNSIISILKLLIKGSTESRRF